MKAREFVESIKEVVQRGSVRAILRDLENPSGRRPDPSLMELSKWFKSLSVDDRKILQAMIDMTAKHATYCMFLVLDRLVAIEPMGPKGKLELFYDNGKSRTRLNDENGEQLSSLFKEDR